ncbi:uncharacterized protein ACLA_042610 [Aspergillus clavatus NRRL 1]|uniref:Uncharacterized protein n=1 Tax=Aspergillus clavatus (strain ATCC 1007 / CBS 513.65 / DSM 816 / NCTC 3887 / NRRL 1 / QM 1276 / 107) TaxID=344612 RepID=A1CLL4_ASPCL|nr:uncharacterized protein ACLA_042610 [Aspergillus clavatus NRRL 1]EAW10038.1 hypothetical protein ACLA_042610 [Aspergillus clavatus NRRL 1]
MGKNDRPSDETWLGVMTLRNKGLEVSLPRPFQRELWDLMENNVLMTVFSRSEA